MKRSLVVKLTRGAEAPETANQAFTVAATALTSGVAANGMASMIRTGMCRASPTSTSSHIRANRAQVTGVAIRGSQPRLA